MHPQSYLAAQQIAEDRRRDLQQSRRAAQQRAERRAQKKAQNQAQNHAQNQPVSARWSRVLRSLRQPENQPTT